MFACSPALLAATLALVPIPSPPREEPAPRRVTELARRPHVDGELKDLAGATPLSHVVVGLSAALAAEAAVFGDTLYLGIEISDDHFTSGDLLTLSLHAPEAGIGAPGRVFHFSPEGRLLPTAEGAPPYAQAALEAAVHRVAGTITFEVALPPLALPRLPAHGPLVLELCLAYDDQDADGGVTERISTCASGSAAPVRLELPDSVLAGLRQRPPAEVVGLEARPGGWVGFGERVEPRWILADKPLTVPTLRALVSDASLDPASLRLYVPDRMTLPDGGAVLAVLAGQDPFDPEDTCTPDREVRLLLYRVKGRLAERVLEWPARSCALGRALSVALDPGGELTVGYSSGATVRFIWSRDHFERTEYGSL
jgi:hypothetical protein